MKEWVVACTSDRCTSSCTSEGQVPAGKAMHSHAVIMWIQTSARLVTEGRGQNFPTSELAVHPWWLQTFVLFFCDNCMSFLYMVHCTNDFMYLPELRFVVFCLNMQNCMQLHVTSYANHFLCYCAYLKLIWARLQPWLWSPCLGWAFPWLHRSLQLAQEQQPEPPPPAAAWIRRWHPWGWCGMDQGHVPDLCQSEQSEGEDLMESWDSRFMSQKSPQTYIHREQFAVPTEPS